MKHYEYEHIEGSIREVDGYAEEGWRVISFTWHSNGMHDWILEREVEEFEKQISKRGAA